jgi:MFS family permease
MNHIRTQRRWPALGVLAAAQFMVFLDESIVNVALPSIKSDLGYSQAALAWVVNAYILAFGGLVLLGGRLADQLGRRRMFGCSSPVSRSSAPARSSTGWRPRP